MSGWYVIAGREDERAGPDSNWDGYVHTTLDSAQESLKEAHLGGYDYYAIYELALLPVSQEPATRPHPPVPPPEPGVRPCCGDTHFGDGCDDSGDE